MTRRLHHGIGGKAVPGNGYRYKVTGARWPTGIRAGAQHVIPTAI